MKKNNKSIISIILIITAFLFLSFSSFAQEEGTLEEEEKNKAPIEHTYFQSGTNVLIDQIVNGEVFVSGKNVKIEKKLNEHLFFIGGTLQIEEEVRESAFLIGQNIIIKDKIGGDLYAIGSNIQSEIELDEDAYIIAEKVLLKGKVDEELYINAKEVYIDAEKFRGNVFINAELIKINPETRFSGEKIVINNKEYEDLAQFHSEELPIDLSLSTSTTPVKRIKSVFNIYGLLFLFALLIGNSLATMLIFKLFPIKSTKIVNNLSLESTNIFTNLKIGFVSVLAGLILLPILMVSIIGWPILSVILPATALAVGLAKLYLIYKIGNLIIQLVQPEIKNIFITSLVGGLVTTVVLMIVSTIPVIGKPIAIIIISVISLWSIGGVIRVKYEALNTSRKKK
ncbi:hypothetical protein GF362_07230 [Candidatus Dojkabacteria bacterium]|nr:hypothetical protein [Candidatus Dojkabacteria bacterium]